MCAPCDLLGGLAAPAGLHARSLAGLLLEVRGPGRIAEALGLVAVGEREQGTERGGMRIDVGGGIAEPAYALGHRVDPQLARLDRGHLVPGQRARDAGIRRRAVSYT